MRNLRAAVFFPVLLSAALLSGESVDETRLRSFADPERVWGRGVEHLIEEAFRDCFRTYVIDGKIMNLRIPFAENHEREELSGKTWELPGRGKSKPAELWALIDGALNSADFKKYTETLADGKEKVVIFDIPTQKWRVSADVFDITRMKAGSYHGLPHRPYVLAGSRGIEESDVYNYLYCTAWTGLDCSGFVWHILSHVAAASGLDLGQSLRSALGAPRGSDPSIYVGTKFYNSKSRELTAVSDEIKNLKPADIMLFRARDGSVSHSAVVQSVDFTAGVIRYLQSTDEAPLTERGPHESFVYFNPKLTSVSLKDPSLRWTQTRFSPFEGERVSTFADDGQRYRAYGGGRIVRLNIVSKTIAGRR
jgi:hypothetical protein